MELTIGYLENQLRKFPKDTVLSVGCNSCHHGSMGTVDTIEVVDRTDQTFGYVELNLNDTIEPNIGLSKDKEIFYKKEIERLKRLIDKKDAQFERYEDFVKSTKTNVDWLLQKTK